MQLRVKSLDKVLPNLSTQSVVAAVRHEREVMPPPLPYLVVRNAPVEVVSCIGLHPVPIDLLELNILRGQGVTRQVSLLPLPVLCRCDYLSPLLPAFPVFMQGGGMGV